MSSVSLHLSLTPWLTTSSTRRSSRLSRKVCNATCTIDLEKILTCSIASKVKHVRRGVKEVSKAIRKGEKGLVVIAGDISPLDVISHLPVLCEDHDVPYIFVPSKEKLGEASATKRPTSVSMVVLGGKNKDGKAAEDYKELYEECTSQSKKLVSTKKSLFASSRVKLT